MARLRYDNSIGTLGALLSSGGTTITFSSAPSFSTITGSDYIPLILEPASGSTPSTNFEIVWLTAYVAGATSGTISRGQEGTSAVSHPNGVVWSHGPTANDTGQRGSMIYWTDLDNFSISRAHRDGSHIDTNFIWGLNNPYGIAVANESVYYSSTVNNGNIGRARDDGYLRGDSFVTSVTAAGLYSDGTYLYWGVSGGSNIGRCKLDGHGVTTNFITGCTSPHEITSDGTFLYWTNVGNGTIGRATLAGGSVNQSFVSTGIGAGFLVGICTDNTFLYYCVYNNAHIGRCTVAGGSVNNTWLATAANPFDVETDGTYLYYSVIGAVNAIGRCTLAGGSVNNTFLTPTGGEPAGIAVPTSAPLSVTP